MRPFDGDVLYAVANEALMAGDTTRWLEFGRRAFRRGPVQQCQILSDWATCTPLDKMSDMIESVLREFQPDLAARILQTVCTGRCTPEQLKPLLRYRAEQAKIEAARKTDAAAAVIWLEAHGIYVQLGEQDEADHCIDLALECDPNSFDVHYALGVDRLRQAAYAEAESHLRWCVQRSPDNPDLEKQLRDAIKGRLEDEFAPPRSRKEDKPCPYPRPL